MARYGLIDRRSPEFLTDRGAWPPLPASGSGSDVAAVSYWATVTSHRYTYRLLCTLLLKMNDTFCRVLDKFPRTASGWIFTEQNHLTYKTENTS